MAATGWQVGALVVTRLNDDIVECKIVKAQGIGSNAELELLQTADMSASPLSRLGRACEVVDPTTLENLHDLALLGQLSDGSMLHCLRLRYAKKQIYTSIGGVVVAVNPYQELPAVYDESVMNRVKLSDEAGLSALPHPYSLAEHALRGLLRDRKSQSLLISGESGAGKTESVKYALRYIAHRSKIAKKAGSHSSIDELVVQTNPILEAFANAKTTRNDNSSRFGKYIQVFIEPVSGSITSATISSYLLEKARVVEQNPGERNYHGFYQLVKHGRTPLVQSEGCDARKFSILNKGNMVKCDADWSWAVTRAALADLKISEGHLNDIECVLEAVLSLGDATFGTLKISGEDDGSTLKEKRKLTTAQLLGVDETALSEALCARFVAKVRVPNSVENAEASRDGLCKAIYGRLFDWIVTRVNESLAMNVSDDNSSSPSRGTSPRNGATPKSPTRPPSNKPQLFIGLLDIFGFEHFKTNSLEQLLINYANERLQAHFNMVVFANEAREYAAEDVPIGAVEFIDNSGVVLAIEKGVLAKLDEECSLKAGTDENFVAKLHPDRDHPAELFAIRSNRHTSQAERDLVGHGFGVRHFAQEVVYDARGLVAKNRDTLAEALSSLCAESTIALLGRELFPKQIAMDGARGARSGKKQGPTKTKFVAKSFVANMTQLIKILNATVPSFVRCVKPNTYFKHSMFDGPKVLEQLTSMGVLQVVEARKKGYSHRYLHYNFQTRFGVCVEFDEKQDIPLADQLLAKLHLEKSTMIVGKTKTFIKSSAHGKLEALRDSSLTASALAALENAENSIEALEAALRTAAELRLKGKVVDDARARLSKLRFELEFEKMSTALDSADLDSMNVDSLERLLQSVDAHTAGARGAAEMAVSKEQKKSFEKRMASMRVRMEDVQDRINLQAAYAETCNTIRVALSENAHDADLLKSIDKKVNDPAAPLNTPEHTELLSLRADLKKAVTKKEAAINEKAAALKESKRLVKEQSEREIKDKSTRALGAPVVLGDDEDLEGGTRESETKTDNGLPSAPPPHMRRKTSSEKKKQLDEDLPPTPPSRENSMSSQRSGPKPIPRAPEYLEDSEMKVTAACFKRLFQEPEPCPADVIELTVEQRRAMLKTEFSVMKLSEKEKHVTGEWKLLKLSDDGRITWRTNASRKSAMGSFSMHVREKRSDGTVGVGVERITDVIVGPGAQHRNGVVATYQSSAYAGKAMPTVWHYLTLGTRERGYHFGFSDEVHMLMWATTIERLADNAQMRERRFGDGVLSRAQRTFVEDPSFGRRGDLTALCPVLHSLSPVLQAVCSRRSLGGAFFGARAPEHLKKKLSWLGCAVVDALEEQCGIVRDDDDELIAETGLKPGEIYAVDTRAPPRAVDSAVAWVSAHTERRNGSRPNSLSSRNGVQTTPRSDRSKSTMAGASAAKTKLRPSASRAIPARPCIADLFAACAKGDPDLIEALVLRCRIRVDSRYKANERGASTWVDRAGPALRSMEPQVATTPLCYVVTWCDVLGEAAAEKVIRRLLMLRADTSLDDAHPEVRFPPLCAAVANSSVRIALTLLHAGAEPDAVTSDGRSSLHILQLASQANIKNMLLHALVSAGADVNFQVFLTGDTPLHVAAADGSLPVVSALIEAGANPTIENLAGLTPAESAMLELQLYEDDAGAENDVEAQTKIKNLKSCAELLS